MTPRFLLSGLAVAFCAALGFSPTQGMASGMALTPTTTTISSSSNPSEVHSALTVSATVSRQASSGTPTGAVAFYANGLLLGTVALSPTSTASVTTSSAPVWTTSVQARYQGDSGDHSSSASMPQTIAPHSTQTALTTSYSPAKFGLGVTITASVSAQSAVDGPPHGTVMLIDSSTVPATKLGSMSLNSSDVATFQVTSLTAGLHTLVAQYQGQSLFAPSTSTGLQQQILAYAYVGALPFDYEAGFVSATTNVVVKAQTIATSPAAGISWKFRWSDLETQSGVYDWTPIDRAITASHAVHLPVILRVIAGIYTPAWVLGQVPTVAIPNQYFPSTAFYANPTVVPVLWDSAYVADWGSFIRALGARYDGSSDVRLIEMSGEGVIGEMYLPPDMSAWNGAGYSDAGLLSATESTITTYAQAFRTTPLALGIDEPFVCGAVSPGFINPTCASTYRSNVLSALVAWVAASYPTRVSLQQNGLKGTYLTAIFGNRQILRAACEYSAVGYQMSAVAKSATDLHDSFTAARQDQVSYVEVYTADLLNSAYATHFHYLEYGTP